MKRNKIADGFDERKWVTILFFISFLLRLAFCISKPYNISAHDLGGISDVATGSYYDGHIGYIQYICENYKLPDTNLTEIWSFYNPPLYYLIAAVFLKANLLTGMDMYGALECLQLLNVVFATAVIYLCYKILKEFKISGKAVTFAIMIIVFHPYFIIGGVTLNNDMLSILFIMAAILYTIRWYKDSSYKNSIVIALAVGFGMMTKLSVATVAPAIAMVFLVKLIKEKRYLYYIRQFAVFGLLCIPLGLYWSVRNAILFDMPLLYVQPLGTDSGQYLVQSAWKRINPFDLSGMKSPFVEFNVGTDYQIWTEMFKSAVFDELNLKGETGIRLFICQIFLYGNIILGIGAVATGVYNSLKNEIMDVWLNRFKYVIYLLFMGSYIKFCFAYPQICSMNFRYIVPTLLIGAVNLGVYMESNQKNKIISTGIACMILTCSLLSAVVYLFIM